LLTVAGILVVGAGLVWLMTMFPHGDDVKTSPVIVDRLQDCLIWGALLAVPIIQFARRRRWRSLVGLAGAVAINTLLSVVVPSAMTTETEYPVVQPQQAPVKIDIRAIPEIPHRSNASGWSDAVPDVYLNIPVSVSGVAPGSMVRVDLLKLTADSPQSSRWSLGWKYQSEELWPEDQLTTLSYEVNRKEYEKVKSVPMNIHLELALSEYEEGDARLLRIPAQDFRDTTLGICRIGPPRSKLLECLTTFHEPGFMATADPRDFPCPKDENDEALSGDAISYAWKSQDSYSFLESGFSPLVNYSIWFKSASLFADFERKTAVRLHSSLVCPGTEIRLAEPVLKRQQRIKLEMSNVRLQDIAGSFTR